VTATVLLPTASGVEEYRPRPAPSWQRTDTPIKSRLAFAATHVVADPRADNAPGRPAVLDWESTLRVRHELWSWGLGVAEAMDTAQRGMGLDWVVCAELIRRSAADAKACGGRIVAGVNTDQLDADERSLARIADGYAEQLEVVEECGATPVIMASRQLAAAAAGADDYLSVYDRVLSQVGGPVLLHWLGDMFDPSLSGYWGNSNLDVAADTFVELVRTHTKVIDGVKVSLLDADREVRLRKQLPVGVRLYTGDDFNYPELILGDGDRHSDALLGAFAAIAPAAATALRQLDAGDAAGFMTTLQPTLTLSRHIFAAPTQYYKTGIAFLSWLNGVQPGFTMVGGLHSGRSVSHLVQTFRLADAAGVLTDPELAVHRLSLFLAVAGYDL
jgi:hypothetical protein